MKQPLISMSWRIFITPPLPHLIAMDGFFQLSQFILCRGVLFVKGVVHMGRGAGAVALVFVIALPDNLSVLVVAVPDLRAVGLSAVSADDLPG